MHQTQNQKEDLTFGGGAQKQSYIGIYWTQYFLYHKSLQPSCKVGNLIADLKMKTQRFRAVN